MTDQELERANKLKTEIQELESFIWRAKSVWTGKIIKRQDYYIFKSNAYGCMDSAEYNMNTETKNKVLKVLEDHLADLKKQLHEI